MRALAIFIFAFLSTILQISFLSHLPSPISYISIPIIAISYAIFTNRPIMGALWALVAGFTLDLHGFFEFGTEITLLLLVFYILRFTFRRFITNWAATAMFLLTALGILIHWTGLAFLDGIRVLFGGIPQIISLEWQVLAQLVTAIIVNGSVVTGLLFAGRYLRRRFEHVFFLHT